MKSLGPYQQVERRSPEAKKDLKECRICWSKRQYRTYLRNNLRYMLWPSSLSSTCRRHVADIAKCRQILADIACRCDTEEAPTYPIYVNYSRQVQVSPNIELATLHRVLCLNSGISRHVVKCRVV